jgi:DNA-binding CsgD family transcriptional regulator
MVVNLLERETIFAELHRLLRHASEGQGSLVLLAGEAGAGKTAVLRRFVAENRAGARVLVGHCDALSTPRVLGPLFDIARQDAALRRFQEDTSPRDLVFRGVLDRLAAGRRVTLLAIEDAHWADEATLDLLRYLGRRIEPTRGLVIVTYRDDEVGSRHPLRHVLGDLATSAAIHRLEVRPLSIEGVATLAAGSGIDADELHARTGGNPFFVTEVLAANGGIPSNVRDAVLARVARLGRPAWDVLEAAAVIGAAIDPALLQSIAQPTAENLEACVECGVLGYCGQRLVFRHELVREAILAATSPTRRAALHARVLPILEASPADSRDLALLAHHAEEAGDRAAVLRHAPEAARRAAHLRAHREAADHYAQALRFAGSLPSEERARLLEARAYECYLIDQIDLAVAAREEALAIWFALGNRLKVGENRCHLAVLHWVAARTDDANREAVAAVSALATLAPGRELAMAYATLGRLQGPTVGTAEGIAWGERAIALAERLHDVETLIDALIDVGALRLAAGDDRGHQLIERGRTLALEAGLDERVARAYHYLGFGYGERYRFRDAAPFFMAGIAFCADRDLDHSRQYMTAWLAYCRYFLGEWPEAFELANTVLQAPEISSMARFAALCVAGMIRARRGDPEAGPLLDEALAQATTSNSFYQICGIRAARAEAAWLRGDRAGAAGEARAAYDIAVTHGQDWYAGELAYWRHRAGDILEPSSPIAGPFALQIAEEWQAAAAAWDELGCPYEAARARMEGNDESALRAALNVFEALGAQPAAAHTRRRLRKLGVRGIPRGPQSATRANPAGLTSREIDVLALLAIGCGNQEIAERLFLSPRTVQSHVAAIFAKLGTGSRTQAVAAAFDLGIAVQSE